MHIDASFSYEKRSFHRERPQLDSMEEDAVLGMGGIRAVYRAQPLQRPDSRSPLIQSRGTALLEAAESSGLSAECT